MNKLIIAFLLMIDAANYAQLQNADIYFPHSVGNVWQYLYNEGRLEQVKIERDSLDSDGNIFLNYGQTPFPFFYWRYKINHSLDSIFYLPFSSNILLYKFPLEEGEVYGGDSTWYLAYVYNIDSVMIFGKERKTIEIRFFSPPLDTANQLWVYTYILAENLGLVQYFEEVEYKTLIGCVIDGDTMGIVFTRVSDENKKYATDSFVLYQNYPNPFNPVTTIKYSIPSAGTSPASPARGFMKFVQLKVYDVIGNEVATLVNEQKPPGNYIVKFDGSRLPSGVYIYRLTVGNYSAAHKLVLLK